MCSSIGFCMRICFCSQNLSYVSTCFLVPRDDAGYCTQQGSQYCSFACVPEKHWTDHVCVAV